MTVSRVPSIPWSIYSHCTITATIHPPHTLHNLLTPSYLWKETKTLLHTSAEVSNSDCPLWSHTSPEQSIFILPPIRLFSASLSASPGLLHHLYHLHASMPQWKCADMAGWRWQRSDDWKLHCCRRQGDGFVATSLCAPVQSISTQPSWATSIATQSAAAVASRGLPIDLMSWQEVKNSESGWKQI